jgi:hypothetical protein
VAVKLEGNPLVCDCESKWLIDLVDLFAYDKQLEESSPLSKSQPQPPPPPPTQTFLSRKKASKNLARLLDYDSSSIKLVYRRNLNYEQQSTRDKTSNYEIKAERVNADLENVEFKDSVERQRHHGASWQRRWPLPVRKRAIEEISPHFSLDSDPNLSAPYQMPPRQKRIRFGVTKPAFPYLNGLAVVVSDLDLVTCRFIDTQSFDDTNNRRLASDNSNRSSVEFIEYDMMDSVDYSIAGGQNVNANTVRYRPPQPLMASEANEFVCEYADHCRPASECDCCVFLHCHCRSVCPAECKCYYDAARSQNIIDCSARGLADMPSTENPIESATDIRLSGNALTTVRPHTFFGFGSVRFLYMQDNRIGAVGREAFEDLRYTLKLLNLANNALEFIDLGEVANFVELEVVVLSRNPLKLIDQYASVLSRSSLPNLKV